MSRSNPNDHGSANPSVRWFEWNGETGSVRYYDKDAKANVDVPLPFTFILLDQLGSVRGWSDATDSGIYSNEVKDTRQDVLVVKSFKGGVIAEGIYADIKDKVNRAGGQFVANCYIAFRHDGKLAIGSLRFKGAALGAWMEFCKASRTALYEQAVKITSFTEGKKGRIVFRTPVFQSVPITAESNAEAIALDRELQKFFAGYLKHNAKDAAASAMRHQPDDHDDPSDIDMEDAAAAIVDDDIPFAWALPIVLPIVGAIGAALPV